MILKDDHSEETTVLVLGSLRWYIIKRTKGYAIRLRDLDADEARGGERHGLIRVVHGPIQIKAGSACGTRTETSARCGREAGKATLRLYLSSDRAQGVRIRLARHGSRERTGPGPLPMHGTGRDYSGRRGR